MNLKEWCRQTGILPTHPTTERGAVSLILERDALAGDRVSLFHLTDYAVSSVSGPVYWLVPRPTAAEKAYEEFCERLEERSLMERGIYH